MGIGYEERKEIERLDVLKRLLGKGELLVDSESPPGENRYLVRHNYNIDKYFDRLNCLYKKNPRRNFLSVKSSTLMGLIAQIEEQEIVSQDIKIGVSVGSCGDNCRDTYTNHLSDYEIISFRGEGRISLDSKQDKILGEILNGEYHIV